jgi:stage V sporulation protein R
VSDWGLQDLEKWDDKICEMAKGHGLDWFPIIYETCDYFEMIGNMAYHGMPTHYNHWSYGKQFERTHQMYNLGAEGLPYELIINSDPSIAYLMRENPLYLQILIMCHCVGHSDFFKNNRMFSKTNPENVVSRMRSAKKRIQGYIEDPSIGVEKVESFLDACHSISHQTYRFPGKRLSHAQLKEKYTKLIKNDENGNYTNIDINRVPLEPEYDILGFVLEHSTSLDAWQKDLLEISKSEALYFMPQIRTKIMNEGWASYWHYRLMHELELPQKFHIPFIKSHNQVIRPHLGAINPYHLGFHLFKRIEERHGLDRCFLARETCHDESFIREYLTEEDCRELNLFAFSTRNRQTEEVEIIDDISDEEGWKKVKQDLIKNVGGNTIPIIYVSEIEQGNILVLEHEHDGRDLELDYADAVVQHVSHLWGDVVRLNTIIEEEPFEI